MDLNKTVGELKKSIFEKTKIPINRLKFILNNIELIDEFILVNENLFENNFQIKITNVNK